MSQVKVRVESIEGDFAIVVIDANGQEQKQNFVRVDGKWVPEMMGASFRPMLQFAKDMIPTYAAQINAQKPKVMPVLEQLEPLIDALQKAKTQEEFNTAFANFNAQAPQLVASAMGPGFGAMMGGGTVQVSPVKIKLQVTGPMTDKQLSEIINKLEALTDDPERAITFPTDTSTETPTTVASSNILTAETINALQITPVSDPQIFADAIKAAEVVNSEDVQFDPQTKIITLSLKFEAPPQPAETTDSENPDNKR